MGERTVLTQADGRKTVTDTRTLAEAKAERLAVIKEAAQARIYAIAPAWKQANLTARGTEVALKLAQGGTLSAGEAAEQAAGLAVWAAIKAVRTASNVAEAAVMAATDNAAVDAVPF